MRPDSPHPTPHAAAPPAVPERAERASMVVALRRASVPPARRRPWERFIAREEVAHLLAARRYVDLLARLTEARAAHPYDLELLRSVRVLEHHLGPRLARSAG